MNEQFDGQLRDLKLGASKHVLIYDKPDFTPATYTVLNWCPTWTPRSTS